MVVLMFALAAPMRATEKGELGFGLNVKLGGSSLFKLIVAWASIKSIALNSPADGHGIAIGDLLMEVDGLAVPGCKGSDLKAKLTVAPGRTVRLKFKRNSGEIYAVEITAVGKSNREKTPAPSR